MTVRSGRGTRQTSFTPSAQVCGFCPESSKRSSAAAVRWPGAPLGEDRHARRECRNPARSAPSSSPARPRPWSPVRTPTTRPSSTRSAVAAVSGRIVAPPSSATAARKRPSSRERDDERCPSFRIVGGIGTRRLRAAVRKSTASPGHLAVGRQLAGPRAEERARAAPARSRRPESRCEPGALPFSTHRHRHLAEPARRVRVGGGELAEPDRRREARGARADDEHADLDRVGVRRRRRSPPRCSTAAGSRRASRAPALPDERGEPGHDLVQVADDAEVGVVEDRRVAGPC